MANAIGPTDIRHRLSRYLRGAEQLCNLRCLGSPSAELRTVPRCWLAASLVVDGWGDGCMVASRSSRASKHAYADGRGSGVGQKSRVSTAANPLRTKVPEFMTHTNGYNARSAAKQRVTQQYVRREGHEGRCN